MTKPKTLEQLRTEKERAETQLAQEQQVPSRFMRKIVCRLRLNEVSRQ